MRRPFGSAVLSAALVLLGGCGGGGGEEGALLQLLGLTVLTQSNGPLSPFGTTHGGDEVELQGAGFVGGADVFFGNGLGTGAVVQNPTRIRVRTPAGTAGLVDVRVVNPGGDSATLDDAFRFVAPPSVLSVSALTGPTFGESRAPIAGGVQIRVDGSDFKPGATAFVEGVAVTTSFVDATRVDCAVPPVADELSADVRVRNPEGLEGTLPDGLDYTKEFSLAPEAETLTEARARHLFRRGAFGASSARIAQAVAEGLTPSVDGLLDFTPDTATQTAALAVYGATPPPNAGINTRQNQEWWIHLLLRNANPLQERIAWFLHDHFATSQRNFGDGQIYWMHDQIQLFRRFTLPVTEAGGLGYDWKRLCIEVAKDKAMLLWLDGVLSTANAPNENFARELWELFMLGEGNGYTQEDIVAASKAFTGFRVILVPGTSYYSVQYVTARHDNGNKTILGETGAFGYDSVAPYHQTGPTTEVTNPGIVDLTLRRRPTEASRFLCRRLVEHLLYENPHAVVVDELAGDLVAANWNLKPVLRKILRSKAMFSTRALKSKVKGPVEYGVGFLRATNIALTNSQVRTLLTNMGQPPMDPPDVNGWEEGLAWMASQSMLERINFLNTSVSTLDNVPLEINPLLPPAGQRSPSQLVDHLSALLDVQLSGEARNRYIQYVTQALDAGGNVIPFAFDPNNNSHLVMKTRGLIYMIGQDTEGHEE